MNAVFGSILLKHKTLNNIDLCAVCEISITIKTEKSMYMQPIFFKFKLSDICPQPFDCRIGPKSRFFAPDKLANHTSEGKKTGEKK